MNFLSGFNANLLDGVKRLHFIGIGVMPTCWTA